jgi:hypothetical protein
MEPTINVIGHHQGRESTYSGDFIADPGNPRHSARKAIKTEQTCNARNPT